MSKYRLTTLSPIHISSGNEFELNFNLLEKDNFVYIYDEFSIVDFFIAHGILVPLNLDRLKQEIKKHSKEIVASNLHIRKIETYFYSFTKPLLENVTTAYNPIITGSSIKGSLRTAILDCMTNLNSCENLKNGFKERTFDEKRFQKRFDNDLANLFKYLKVTDSYSLLETQIYKTINVKKEKLHQKNREPKTEKISNYVEAIKPNQSFIIEIKDTHEDKNFQNIGIVCNQFYIPFLGRDEKIYFSQSGYLKDKITKLKLSNNIFLINVGRFSGAEQKSLNNLREIKGVKEEDKSKTTARTFALEKNIRDKELFENKLLPFGWILCEKIDKEIKIEITKNHQKDDRFRAIDAIHRLQESKIEEQREKEELKKEAQKREAETKAKKEAEEKAKLASMTPVQRLVDSYNDMAVLINNMRAGKIEDLNL